MQTYNIYIYIMQTYNYIYRCELHIVDQSWISVGFSWNPCLKVNTKVMSYCSWAHHPKQEQKIRQASWHHQSNGHKWDKEMKHDEKGWWNDETKPPFFNLCYHSRAAVLGWFWKWTLVDMFNHGLWEDWEVSRDLVDLTCWPWFIWTHSWSSVFLTKKWQ
jgi:hypothetical protein